MSTEILLLIITSFGFISFILEKTTSWITHISGVGLIILVAIILSNIGLIPNESNVYNFFTEKAIYFAIILMLFTVSIKDVFLISKKIIIAFFLGVIFSFTGAIVSGLLGYIYFGDIAIKLAAQLGASYIGGGENAVAMKLMLNIPNEYFVAVFTIDNIITAVWMIILLAISKDTRQENETAAGLSKADATHITGSKNINLINLLACIALALLVYYFSFKLYQYIPIIPPILLMTIVGVSISQVGTIRNFLSPAYMIGSLIFVYFFFSIGAMSNLMAIKQLPLVIILMPIIIVLIHGALLFSLTKLMKISIKELALISQLLIGGPATAIAFAQAKSWHQGIAIGIVLGLLGYGIGNIFGATIYYLVSQTAASLLAA